MIASINSFTPWWLGLFGGVFAVLEGWALHVQKRAGAGKGVKNGTLSALVWRFINWKGGAGHKVARVVFTAFWLDLSSHFFFQTQLTPWF